MVDALLYFKNNFGGCLLDHPENKPPWRLDYTYADRSETRHCWLYLEWDDVSTWASKTVQLNDDEVYGYLKATHPEIDVKKEIKEEVKKRLSELIKEIN